MTQHNTRILRPAIPLYSRFSADYYLLGKSDSVELAVHLHWEMADEEAAHTELAGCRERMDSEKRSGNIRRKKIFLGIEFHVENESKIEIERKISIAHKHAIT